MTIEQRLSNLENLVFAQSKRINDILFYQSADNAGMRQGIGNVTPYTETKTAYIGDTEVVFTGAKSGNLSVFIASEEGSETGYTLDRIGDMITVRFTKPIEYVTEVTISII